MGCCHLTMLASRVDRMPMGCQCDPSESVSNDASGTPPNAATGAIRKLCLHVLDFHKGLSLFLLLLMLLTRGLPVSGEYSFDENEIPGTADASLPLPRPFDATACSFNHLAQQRQLLVALQQLQPSANRNLLQDASVEALLKATQSGIVVDEADRFIKFGQQAEITVKLKITNRGASPVSALLILLPYSEATQLGWIAATTKDGKNLTVQSLLPPLPSISTLRWEDWGLRPLLLEQTERHLKRATEGQGDAFVSRCWPHLFRLHLKEPLQASKSTRLTVSYALGRPYRPLPRSVDLESIQSVVFATSSNWPLPYKTLRSAVSLQLPPQTTLGEAGERHMRAKSFRKLQGEVWKWESTDPLHPLEVTQPFAVIFPLPQHLGYVLTIERLLVVPLSGSATCKDFYKIHNDAALLEVGQQAVFAPPPSPKTNRKAVNSHPRKWSALGKGQTQHSIVMLGSDSTRVFPTLSVSVVVLEPSVPTSIEIETSSVNHLLASFEAVCGLLQGAFNPVTLALLQGLPPGISRLAAKSKDVPRSKRVPTHVLFDVHATLPPDVFNLDVGDSAGNLTSTFAARDGPKEAPLSTHLEVWPRFPVLGGWNFDLKVSYEMPVSSLVVQDGSKGSSISLNIPLEPPFVDLYAEHISLTVALPTGAINARYSSPVDFDSVEETTVKWWLDVVTSRPALRLKWHSASPIPTQHKGRFLAVTFDYPYSVDLEYLKKAFILVLVLFIIAVAAGLYQWKLRFSTTEDETTATPLHDELREVKKELWRRTEAAICEGRAYMDSVAAARSENSQTGMKQKRTQEQEERYMGSLRQHEADLLAFLDTVPEASSSFVAFKKALERHREALQAFTTALLGASKEKAEEATQEVDESEEHLRVLARGWKVSNLKQHEA